MKFKGMEIGLEPTMNQIEVYICEKSFNIEAKDVYDHYKSLKWCTRKGTPLVSVEAMVDSYNGVYIYRLLKKQKHKELKDARNGRKGSVKQIINAIKVQNNKKKPYTEYEDQLNDYRWKAFRQFVFTVRGKECEMCGCKRTLQVHHLEYKNNMRAWEYGVNDVMVVCDQCHKKIHKIQ